MSRGPSHVQRALIAAFTSHPGRRFTNHDVAELVYPGEGIAKRHTDAIIGAMLQRAAMLGLRRCRVGQPKRSGWTPIWLRR